MASLNKLVEKALLVSACAASGVTMFAGGVAYGKYQSAEKLPTGNPQAEEFRSDANDALNIGVLASLGGVTLGGLALVAQSRNLRAIR